jgi:hypothetical protein
MLNEMKLETIAEIIMKDASLGKTPVELAPVIDLLSSARAYKLESKKQARQVRYFKEDLEKAERDFKASEEKAEALYEAALTLMPNSLSLSELSAYLEIQSRA